MPDSTHDFAAAFVFRRDGEGPCRDDAGVERTAVWNEPRFDHDAAGSPFGLLVEGWPQVDAADRIDLAPDLFVVPAKSTVLHALQAAGDDEPEYRAYYAMGSAVLGLVRSRLRARGHHLCISVIPSHLDNRGGFVRWARHDWRLGALISVDATGVVAGVQPITNPPILLEG